MQLYSGILNTTNALKYKPCPVIAVNVKHLYFEYKYGIKSN